MRDKTVSEHVCPRCGRIYTERPAMARDNSGPICPDCGTREALESIGVDTAEQDKIIEAIHACQRRHGHEH